MSLTNPNLSLTARRWSIEDDAAPFREVKPYAPIEDIEWRPFSPAPEPSIAASEDPGTAVVFDELSIPNRVPSTQEISVIRRIISDDIEMLSDLDTRIEKRRAAAERSQKTVDNINATLMCINAVQSARRRRLEMDIMTQQELNSAAALPALSTVTQQVDYDIPKLDEITAYYFEELEKWKLRVQEGVNEVDRCNKWNSELRQRLLECRSRLLEETRSLEAVRRCATELRSEISRRKKAISAGRRLPSDILEHIFCIYIQRAVDEIRKNTSRPQRDSVMVLSAVCRGWRRHVAAIPYLWSYIPLPTPSQLVQYQKNAPQLAQYIKNARKSITLDYPKGGPWVWDATVTKTAPSPSRRYPSATTTQKSTKRTSVRDGLKYFADNILSPNKLEFMGVSSFEVLFENAGTALQTAECLWPAESYCLRNGFLRFSSLCAAMVRNVTISLPFCNISDLLAVLRSLTNLQTLELTVKAGFNTEEDVITLAGFENDPFKLPYLSRFTSNPNLLYSTLDSYITAPCLERMGVLGAVDDTTNDWSSLAFRLSLQDRIIFVTFSGATSLQYTKKQFIPLVRELSSVQTVELEGPHLSPLIEYLNTNLQMGQKIQNIICHGTDISEDTLRSLVLNRRTVGDAPSQPNAPLKILAVTLDSCTGVSQSFCEELEGLVDQLIVHC
ncbi:hypothetical protein FRC17_010688 [Serendipita sp. 399]|nr:hypothetical protein FRC17_010688 [Serendipita sp. 399]